MPSIANSDLARMHDALLFTGAERARKLSAFWTLLTLAAIIATGGIITDSTATVIGAMIVAPLMTPILGTVFSVVTADGRNLARSLALVVGGAALVVLIGYVMGRIVPVAVDRPDQLAGRLARQPEADGPHRRARDRRGRLVRARPLGRLGHAAGRRDRDLAGAAALRRRA